MEKESFRKWRFPIFSDEENEKKFSHEQKVVSRVFCFVERQIE